MVERLTLLLSIAALAGASAGAAASGTPSELATSNLNTSAGRLTALTAGAHQASTFPIALRLTTPDGSWAGAQWTSSSRGKPAFGWAAVGKGGTSPTSAPLGLLMMETAIGPTPAVPVILARLRSAGGGTTFGKTTRMTLAGFAGWQIDGKVFGQFGHTFVPFSPKTGGASPADHFRLDPGEAFRLIVLDVKGKRVFIELESFGLPADQFPTFLTEAAPILKSLKFSS